MTCCDETRPNSILPATPRDLFAKRDLLRNGPFLWDSFTLDRIRNAVALYRSQGISRPLRASDMDEPHPDAVPDQRERVRPQKDKGIALEDRNFLSEDLPLPGWNPGFTPGDGSGTSEAPLSVLLLQHHWMKRQGEKWSRTGMRVFNSTLDGSFREACLSHFKAEDIENKFIRFQNEVAERERRQAESHSRALIRAERNGRRTISAELARRATLFDAEFRSFKDAQDYVGGFRECRGSVGTLWKSQNADFSFLSEISEMSGLMDGCAHAESMVPPIEGRIRELWEPITVSEDTTEAGADAVDKGGEVDQPADSFGVSMSGPTVAVCYLSVLWPCKFSSKDSLDGMPLSWAFLRPTLDYCDLLQVNLGSTTVSGVGLSAGKAMDSGTMSLFGVVAWSVLGGRSESRRRSFMPVPFEISPARSFAASLAPRTLQFIVE
ncbi:hypothetical protein F2Q69_00015725 [Brassica cretica]|uniref:Uncharacterized protein n=1 Tax=Brassica cretica TaxID=69181 RepID=A0A8S9QK54_BRACR|nr:hypothetical protein F2Q69_00015725 [Brassica cretica]